MAKVERTLQAEVELELFGKLIEAQARLQVSHWSKLVEVLEDSLTIAREIADNHRRGAYHED